MRPGQTNYDVLRAGGPLADALIKRGIDEDQFSDPYRPDGLEAGQQLLAQTQRAPVTGVEEAVGKLQADVAELKAQVRALLARQ